MGGNVPWLVDNNNPVLSERENIGTIYSGLPNNTTALYKSGGWWWIFTADENFGKYYVLDDSLERTAGNKMEISSLFSKDYRGNRSNDSPTPPTQIDAVFANQNDITFLFSGDRYYVYHGELGSDDGKMERLEGTSIRAWFDDKNYNYGIGKNISIN